MTLSTLQNYGHYGLPVWQDESGSIFAIATYSDLGYSAAFEAAKESLHEVKASFLVNYIEGSADINRYDTLSALEEIVANYQRAMGADSNFYLLELVGFNLDEMIDDLIAENGYEKYLGEAFGFDGISSDLQSALDSYYFLEGDTQEFTAYKVG